MFAAAEPSQAGAEGFAHLTSEGCACYLGDRGAERPAGQPEGTPVQLELSGFVRLA
jgi:hypothetical protein